MDAPFSLVGLLVKSTWPINYLTENPSSLGFLIPIQIVLPFLFTILHCLSCDKHVHMAHLTDFILLFHSIWSKRLKILFRLNYPAKTYDSQTFAFKSQPYSHFRCSYWSFHFKIQNQNQNLDQKVLPSPLAHGFIMLHSIHLSCSRASLRHVVWWRLLHPRTHIF